MPWTSNELDETGRDRSRTEPALGAEGHSAPSPPAPRSPRARHRRRPRPRPHLRPPPGSRGRPPPRLRGSASPDSLPNPALPEGTDTLPQIEHIVVLMMENHSYDDHFGMLKRGDGFKLGSDGLPLDANLYTDGKLLKAFHMPSTCQLHSVPARAGTRATLAFNHGTQRRFREGQRTGRDGLLGRHRHSLLLRPRRRPSPSPTATSARCSRRRTRTVASSSPAPRPGSSAPPTKHSSRRHRRTARSSSASTSTGSRGSTTTTTCRPRSGSSRRWRSRTRPRSPRRASSSPTRPRASCRRSPSSTPTSAPSRRRTRRTSARASGSRRRSSTRRCTGRRGTKTLLIWTYDEHGGYYDHVPPPRAIKPDNIPPDIHVPPDLPGGLRPLRLPRARP